MSMAYEPLMKPETRREGFWYSHREPNLPMPFSSVEPWPGKADFLMALVDRQLMAEQESYRGWSACRCCDKANGHLEYYLDGWCWPQGLYHYVNEHNVRPSLAFQEFIIGKRIE